MIFGIIIRKLHALEHTSVRLWASKARFLIADHVSGCVPDGTANPAEFEGMLSNYSDEESSVDWIRAIRDNC